MHAGLSASCLLLELRSTEASVGLLDQTAIPSTAAVSRPLPYNTIGETGAAANTTFNQSIPVNGPPFDLTSFTSQSIHYPTILHQYIATLSQTRADRSIRDLL